MPEPFLFSDGKNTPVTLDAADGAECKREQLYAGTIDYTLN